LTNLTISFKDKEMSTNLCYASIGDVSQLLARGELSPIELVELCLERIHRLNPELNAFITVLSDDARAQAKQADAEIRSGQWRGPLHGIPIGIKDFFDTAGIKTTAAFEPFKDRVPSKDAVAVTKLKRAGAIIIGKTNMHTLGMGTTGLTSAYGQVFNPWNKNYITGGSSSGSAVAVASGLCFATLDTDAVGSVRLPAACCGVVGFKPTYGRISLEGILADTEPPDPFIVAMGHAGITTRTAEDTEFMLDILAESEVAQAKANQSITLGIGSEFMADADIMAAFHSAINVLSKLYGTETRPIPFGDPDEGLSNISLARQTVAEQFFTDVDVLLLPTTLTTVPLVKMALADPDEALSAENTAFANYYGLPAVSVPCGFDSAGLPIGLQIVGRPGDERTVLQVAQHYQKAAQASRKPPIQ
jgi:aspartyl-tRNA(Asn)/glutamyl-tRNA(Gln) amidotransferase subunit A